MDNREKLKTIISREHMHTSPQCPACGMNFTMGEPAVLACGSWGNELRPVHEADVDYDGTRGRYVVKESLRS